MSSHTDGVVVANALMLLVGTGLLPILRLARTRRELVVRLPLAYAIGLAATGIAAVVLAVIGISAGRLALVLFAAASLALGLTGLPGGARLRFRRPDSGEAGALVLLAATAVFAVELARTAVVKPLLEPGEWQIWATRAKWLYFVGHPASLVFTATSRAGGPQPILLPALEALDFHFMGAADATAVHLQLFLFAVAFAGAAWTLLRSVSSPLLLAASLLAVFAAPAFSDGLLENTPAVPAAILAALGVAALAVWLRRGDGALLAGAAIFLGAAALTSSDGECLAFAALAAAAIAAPRGRLVSLAPPAIFVAASDLVWRGWLAHDGEGQRRGHPAAGSLWHATWSTGSWSFLSVLVLVGLAGALVERHFRRAIFVASWLVLSFAALLMFGSAPASGATTAGLLLGGTLLVSFLLDAGPLPARVPAPARTVDPLVQAAGYGRGIARRFHESYGLPRRTPATLRTSNTPACVDGFPWARPRRELLLLGLVAAATLTPVVATGAQDAARICLTRAALHLHLSNDSCLNGPYARDKSTYHGHLYSDKAPGMSILEVPAVVAARIPSTYNWPLDSVRLWIARVTTSGLALLICAFLIGRMSEGLARGYGGVSLVTFALGTLVAPLGVANFEHVTAAALALGAFALAWRRRPLLAGLAAGATVVVAYEAALIAAIILIYVLATQGLRPTLRFVAGTLPGAVVLLTYNSLAFGAPWHFSYGYKADEFASQQSSGLFGIHLPYLHALHLVFVGRGGLLVISPVVVAAAYGLELVGRRHRPEAIVCGAVVTAFGLLESGYFNPYGGLSPGPRFFVPALPFLALGLGPAFAARFRLTSVLAVLSIVPMTALTLTWSISAPDNGSIWRDLWLLPSQRSSSWIAHTLTSNILDSVLTDRGQAAVIIGVAACIAFALALPVTIRKQRASPG